MKKAIKLLLFGLAFLSISAFPATVNLEINLGGSLITITGDSNIKEWETKSYKFGGNGSFEIENKVLKKINKFSITLDPSQIKAKPRSMNKKIAKTLEIEKFPVITGTIKDSTVKGNKISGKIEFNLHGIKKSLPFNSTISYKNGSFIVKGEQELDMTLFGITPPVSKILFITATVGSDLKIKYKLELVSK